MANRDKATREQDGLEHHREISNTGGRMAEEYSADAEPHGSLRAGDDREDKGPKKAGLKTGDDEWPSRANRRSEKSDGSEPMGGGNTAR